MSGGRTENGIEIDTYLIKFEGGSDWSQTKTARTYHGRYLTGKLGS